MGLDQVITATIASANQQQPEGWCCCFTILTSMPVLISYVTVKSRMQSVTWQVPPSPLGRASRRLLSQPPIPSTLSLADIVFFAALTLPQPSPELFDLHVAKRFTAAG